MTALQTQYHAEFALGEHSAWHLRRILRLYLKGSSLLGLADAAELAMTELLANVVQHVPGRRYGICYLLLPGAVRCGWRSPTATRGCPSR
ncbi:hypothetical protein [Streptomyces antibioticus]|uniref:hypothetical protein n=1 Tax=Streptomyces antibioticus TaxID=1890 RepID=UPI0033E11191